MKIQIDIQGGPVIDATLGQGAAARAFARLLPLQLSLSDYAATEKVADLPAKLDTQGEPAGCKAAVGDLTYYAPWGNLALFYRPFGYASGLVHLGRIDGDLGPLARSGALKATVRLAQD